MLARAYVDVDEQTRNEKHVPIGLAKSVNQPDKPPVVKISRELSHVCNCGAFCTYRVQERFKHGVCFS